MLWFEDVRAGRGRAGGIARVTKCCGCGNPLAGTFTKPFAPAIPPGSGVLLRARQPLLGVGWVLGAGEVLRLGVARRVQDALDVAGAAEDEFRLAAQQLCGCVAPLPGSDMVGDTGGDEGIHCHPGEVYRRAEGFDAARLGQWI